MAHLIQQPLFPLPWPIAHAGGLHGLLVLALFMMACGEPATRPCNVNIRAGYGELYVALCGGSTTRTTPAPVKAKAVTAGHYHTCALLDNGTTRCWGNNDFGQLGTGTTVSSAAPVTTAGLSTATAIRAGSNHTCALLADGTVRCWGYNFSGQLGNGAGGEGTNSSTPVTVNGLWIVKALAAGFAHTCAVLRDGAVRCWGQNSDGQLGTGTTGSSTCFQGVPCETSPVAATGLAFATAITAGGAHACALLLDSTVRCWGRNFFGQLGNGTLTSSPTPVLVSGISTATAVAGGAEHTCALLQDGTVKCWGENTDGELGNGTLTHSSSPVLASGITTATAIEAWETHTCALLQDGTGKCWGKNNFGELGNGTATDASTPVTVSGITTTISVAPGTRHTCAALSDSVVKCWGSNSFGQLGTGTATNATTPVQVRGLTTATAVAAGAFHTCARLSNSTVQCWGLNFVGQLGNGTTTDSSAPILVSGLSTATAVGIGTFHTCARLADSTVRCWGSNTFGQLGDGTTSDLSSTPVAVTGITTATTVATGGDHACALLQDGTARCWGDNSTGGLGNGTLTDSSTPVLVSGLTIATAIATGTKHTCTVLLNGTVRCWGSNDFGQLGVATTTVLSSLPVTVTGLTTATAVTVGNRYTCARLADSTVRCWGIGRLGQLGNGTFGFDIASSAPVTVTGLNTATVIAAGDRHTCARLADSTIRCWGGGDSGQLGTGTGFSEIYTRMTAGLTTATAVTSGGDHACALLSNGTARCWGSNGFGQLGTGATTAVSTATGVTGLTPAKAKAFRACLLADSPVACISLFGITAGRPIPTVVIGLLFQLHGG